VDVEIIDDAPVLDLDGSIGAPNDALLHIL
jgi:hypothetical protein